MRKRVKLSRTQRDFFSAFVKLMVWAHEQGYEFTFGDANAKTGHTLNSFHYKRLAVDINLFIKGVYQKTTAAHKPIGEKWEQLGGTWGGRFVDSKGKGRDGNHYSWGEKRS